MLFLWLSAFREFHRIVDAKKVEAGYARLNLLGILLDHDEVL